jgi:hypothetical protein
MEIRLGMGHCEKEIAPENNRGAVGLSVAAASAGRPQQPSH